MAVFILASSVGFEFVGLVEIVLDRLLAASGDEHEVLDARLARLVDDILKGRPVEHRQHFLGNGLGRRQDARAEAGDGKDGLADRLHGIFSWVSVRDGRVEQLLCRAAA